MENKLANEILNILFQYRRIIHQQRNCQQNCTKCLFPHFSKVLAFIKKNDPITFVLPAFPGKSPNLHKVISHLPDMGEQLALNFLNQICEQIAQIYPPGGKIKICSDGRVFSDLIGISENAITEYQKAIMQIISESNLTHLSTFHLDDICSENNFDKLREDLMYQFGDTLENLRDKVLRGSKLSSQQEHIDAHRLYCGMTRFLAEDAAFPGQTKSRNLIQKESRAKAYHVILRSNAWSELIAQRFPESVRLSIHPQSCGAKKLGIRLIGEESWGTPWHGVVVKMNEKFFLLKRVEAENLGAKLVYSPLGIPSYYELRAQEQNYQSLSYSEA
ncbi:isocyanide synthase family protein [Pigmentibacter sp. JX0631]|uniref:isocyanide synthase family protein n=1 Tax=Pigmentibacter sp. JX0631 TaxID=2976982 RepID=UPI002468AED0|nr:isocyanide synthase family protein [Pigmentibacter sp. JX0631]WGL59737.1 isocyanide synthase family protein [Pigmentibacter sp. JX0631]